MQNRSGFSGYVRAFRRLTAVVVVGLWAAVEALDGGARKWTPAQRATWLQRTCRRALRALGVSMQIEGRPMADAWWMPNHISYLDILALAAAGPVVFVAKSDVRAWPGIGWLAARAGTCFFERRRVRMVQQLGEAMLADAQAGVAVVVFLEGTTSDGSTVLPFRPAFLDTALASGRTILPVAVEYATSGDATPGEHVGWWGETTLLPHLWRLAAIRRIQVRVAFGEAEDTTGVDRKQLAVRLRDRVVELRRSEVGRVPLAPAQMS